MLRLKKLQIIGFKSFCDRVEMLLPGDGIAAVVGPNGCGKSNISDALHWVLGEQNAKSLRGGSMQDVIFAGTAARPATGMAEVSITLIDPAVYDGSVPAEPVVEISDNASPDWDESAVRRRAAEETEEATAALQPGAVADEDFEEPAAPDGVVLKIRRRKFNYVTRKGEIVVTRRLFRSGDSEYLLNGKICRLRDIQDIFMGTGLGPDSYAIIEQERIGQLLSSKPHDRRATIEEAAGVTRFKNKKRLAELRLEQSRLNLARIHDIFEEVTRQMNSLKRQAAKAERYTALRDELRARLKVVLASRLAAFDADKVTAEAATAAMSAEIEAHAQHIREHESASHNAAERAQSLDASVHNAQQHASQATLDIERGVARRAANDERITAIDARHASQLAELDYERERMQSLADEREQHRELLASAESETAAVKSHSAEQDAHAHVCALAVLDNERAIENARAERSDLLARQAAVRREQAQAEEAFASFTREAERMASETRTIESEINALGLERGQIALLFDTTTGQLATVDQQIAARKTNLDALRTSEHETRLELDAARVEHAAVIGRCRSLDVMVREHGYSTDTVQRLLKENAQNTFQTVGTLADFLEVDGQYETVVDEFLRDELNYVVVKSWDAAHEGMRLLKSEVDGRATFLVHPTDAQAKFSFAVDSEQPAPTGSGKDVVRLRDKIHVLDGFGRSLEVILPKLRDGYVAPDASTARTLALENPEAFFLSPSGECFHNVTVSGGRQRAEGPLAIKRELREAQTRAESLASQISSLEAALGSLLAEITAVTHELEALHQNRRELELASANTGATLRERESEAARLTRRLQELSPALDRTRAAIADRRQALTELSAQSESLEQQHSTLESQLLQLQSQTESLHAARESAQHSAAEARLRVATLEERLRGATAQHARIAGLHDDAAHRLELGEQQLAQALAEKEHRIAENLQLAEQHVSLEASRAAALAEAQQFTAQAAELRAQAATAEQALRQLRAESDSLRDRRAESLSALARLTSDLEHLEQTCLNDLAVEAAALRVDPTIARLVGEELAASVTETKSMRERLEAMGPVNLEALQEHAEVAERHAFLEAQRKDLLDSIENTEATIKDIDEVSRVKFDEAFAAINENFAKTFSRLFGGGQAYMRLTDSENSMESGVDIIASPPGKRLQNVLLLSGGEKALTALSLLMAIFQFQPSPFCVLDEVDAPLDETNNGRFCALMRELSEHTQFIIITHSKRTMQDAGLIFGVTMQEPGVSKLVSVNIATRQQQQQRASA